MSRRTPTRRRSRASLKPQKKGRAGRPRKVKADLRVAVVLSVLLAGFIVLTVVSLVRAVQDHGHAHLDLRLVLADALLGIFVAAEWAAWFEQH